jgi:hypothetical protein
LKEARKGLYLADILYGIIRREYERMAKML